MKIILSAFGSYGDIKPFIDIATILTKHGYNVALICNPYFENYVDGFEFYPVGSSEDYVKAIQPNNAKQHYDLVFIKPAIETMETINQISGDKLLLNHMFAYGGKMAADKYGIPNTTLSLSGFWLKQLFHINRISYKGKKEPIQEVLQRTGLNKVKSTMAWMLEGAKVLTPKELMYCNNADSIGFIDAGLKSKMPKGLLKFCKEHNPIVFTPGTWKVNQTAFFKESIKTLNKLGLFGVFLSNYSIKEDLPTNIYHTTFAPLESILKHCRAIVHHGGIGTCYQGLKAQIPQIIFPWMEEQKYNALKLKQLKLCDCSRDISQMNDMVLKMLDIDCTNNLINLKESESKLLKLVKSHGRT